MNLIEGTPTAPIVRMAGINTAHKIDEIMNWVPDGVYVFMLFRTPFEIETTHGRETGRVGQMFINSPGTRQWHRALPGQAFRNDWVHLRAEAVQDIVERCQLPLDQIFNVSDSSFMARIIADVNRERLLNAPNGMELIACYATELILLTSRYHKMAIRMAAFPREHIHYERFCDIRQRLQTKMTSPWTVGQMAKDACLSSNRFAVLYKKFFGVSPMDDLIEMRLAEAKRLLTHDAMTVAEVADACGFNSLSYFSRLFKERVGQPPKHFRV